MDIPDFAFGRINRATVTNRASNALSPANDFFCTLYVEDLDPTTFAPVPVTTGAIIAFLATSNEPDAVAADSSLSVAATHVGVASPTAGQYPLGTWGISLDASALDEALLESLFGKSRLAYLILVRTGHLRLYDKVPYVRYAAADSDVLGSAAASFFTPYGLIETSPGVIDVTAGSSTLQLFEVSAGEYYPVSIVPAGGVYRDIDGNVAAIDPLDTQRVKITSTVGGVGLVI